MGPPLHLFTSTFVVVVQSSGNSSLPPKARLISSLNFSQQSSFSPVDPWLCLCYLLLLGLQSHPAHQQPMLLGYIIPRYHIAISYLFQVCPPTYDIVHLRTPSSTLIRHPALLPLYEKRFTTAISILVAKPTTICLSAFHALSPYIFPLHSRRLCFLLQYVH